MINLNRFEHYTLDSFLAAKARRRDDRHALWMALSCALACVAIFAAQHWLSVDQSPTQIAFAQVGTLKIAAYADDTSLSHESEWLAAFGDALGEWRRVLPGRKVKEPTLMFSSECFGDGAIACADVKLNAIRVKQPDTGADKKTVLMHEIAHLFGVPHIQGDALMDAAYRHAVKRPTEASVALANVYQHRTLKLNEPDE